jgi:hypothetical protein
MVNINLPIHIVMDSMKSEIKVLGICLEYTETPCSLLTCLGEKMKQLFRASFQFKEGQPQETVNVQIMNRDNLINWLTYIFKNNQFATDASIEQYLIDQLSLALAAELTKNLGLCAVASHVYINDAESLFQGIAESLITNFENSQCLPQYLYEQFLKQSPERFPPGKDDEFAPIPFESGDCLSFFLTLYFNKSYINGDDNTSLNLFLKEEEIPVVKFIIRFQFL